MSLSRSLPGTYTCGWAVLAFACSAQEAPSGAAPEPSVGSLNASPEQPPVAAQPGTPGLPAAPGSGGGALREAPPPFERAPLLEGVPDAPLQAPARQVVVSAGAFDREHAVVRFALSAGSARSFQLRDAAGAVLPLQVAEDGTATFILEALVAGQEARYALEEIAAPAPTEVTASAEEGVLRVRVGASVSFDFQLRGALPAGVDPVFLRGGYLYPLYTPAGVPVSDDYPSDHFHHHGLWSAWTSTDVNGHDVDFWNMAAGLGKVDLTSLDASWQGPVHAGFRATLQHTDLVPAVAQPVLTEHWEVTAYKAYASSAPYFFLDLDSTQELVGSSALNLHDYTYGGFALRGNAEWRDVNAVRFTTSEGRDRLAGENEPARWCSISGAVGGRQVGVALLGHAANFRAPQKLRIHPIDPYVTSSPVKDGAFSILPGVPYVSRFRLVTFDGELDPELLDRLWNDFVTPPEARVVESAPLP